MISPEKQSARPYFQPDASAAGDWLRLSIMLLLLVVGKSVAPMHHAPNPSINTASDAPTTHIASFILAKSIR